MNKSIEGTGLIKKLKVKVIRTWMSYKTDINQLNYMGWEPIAVGLNDVGKLPKVFRYHDECLICSSMGKTCNPMIKKNVSVCPIVRRK